MAVFQNMRSVNSMEEMALLICRETEKVVHLMFSTSTLR